MLISFSDTKKNVDYEIINCTISFVIDTELSDFHKMVVTFMKTTFRKLEPKIINFRKYKNFSNDIFRDTL